MISSLVLGEDLRAQIAREATAAFPRECCGLIEGIRDGARIIVLVLHPTNNIVEDNNSFEIDPSSHIALLKQLRGTERAVVGCYHSHPNGRAEPSARDHESAADEGLVWLIQAEELRGFLLTVESFLEVPIEAAFA